MSKPLHERLQESFSDPRGAVVVPLLAEVAALESARDADRAAVRALVEHLAAAHAYLEREGPCADADPEDGHCNDEACSYCELVQAIDRPPLQLRKLLEGMGECDHAIETLRLLAWSGASDDCRCVQSGDHLRERHPGLFGGDDEQS